ncbi:MAG TPA: hypothetical protein VK730_08125 [Solirubrobacteraceae bacterium]|jgi:hypothetical protein|nr:hypothetical protein [Solirubrobacteraceae bacterium]
MSRMFRIPAELVRTLRMGLHSELGGAAQEIESVSDRYGRHRHPEWYEEPLAKFDGVRALLDEVGWGESPKPIDIVVDLTKHQCATLGSLRSQMCIHRDMVEEAEVVDRERAKQGKPPKAPATIARAEALSALFARLWLVLADAEDKAPDPDQAAPPTD